MTISISALSLQEWTDRAEKHSQSISPFSDAFLKRRKERTTDAVHDFLFTYYSCSPTKLKQWVPSFEEQLIITPKALEAHPWLDSFWFVIKENILSLNEKAIHKGVLSSISFIEQLCKNISLQPPRFGCFGLHEWAMVYKAPSEEIRHQKHPLRLSKNELNDFIESQKICCSHYDAYRFFTKEANPLNTLNPTFDNRLEMEQGGCLHANMDLYKWASKLWPWIGSDFIAKTFFLAIEGRELDMRASPYDLISEGYEPICIETELGRRQYQKEQLLYAEKSAVLREELHSFCLRFKHFNYCEK